MTAGDVTGYRLAPSAEDDLEAISRYSADTWSAARADTYLDRLIAILETIATMPSLAREHRAFDPPVRIHPMAEHSMITRIEANLIPVIRILGGRQNWRAMLEVIDA